MKESESFYENNYHLGGAVLDKPDIHTWMPEVWDYMIKHHNVKSMIDVGCGAGFAAKYFIDHDVDAYGVEAWEEAIERSQLPIHRLYKHDYLKGPLELWNFDCAFDLAWAAEFVEHIEEECIENFMATFRCCRKILMTHAISGQGGYHHVNEQNMFYWIRKMSQYGFIFYPMETLAIRSLHAVTGAYGIQTLLYFENKEII